MSKNFYYSDNEKRRICQYILAHTSRVLSYVDKVQAEVDAGTLNESDFSDGFEIRRTKGERFDVSIFRRRRQESRAVDAVTSSFDDNTNWDVEAVADEDDFIEREEG